MAWQQLGGLQTLGFFGNSLSGAMPPNAWSMSGWLLLTKLGLFENDLTGTWPARSLEGSSSLRLLNIRTNRFAGTWPEQGLKAPTSLTTLQLYENMFSGTWPEHALGSVASLVVFSIAWNRFAGTWSSSFVLRAVSLSSLGLCSNSFNGPLDFQAMSGTSNLELLFLEDNQFTGSAPRLSRASLASVNMITAGFNQFAGSFPSEMLHRALAMRKLYFNGNLLQGQLDAEVFTGLTALTGLGLNNNFLVGSWPEHSLGSMTSLRLLIIATNFFTGSLHLQALSRAPELQVVFVNANQFTGAFTFPESTKPQRGPRWVVLFISNNQLEGSLPEALALAPKLAYLSAGVNKLQGSLPRALGHDQNFLTYVTFHLLPHEGMLPKSLNMLSPSNLTLSLGYGLSGTLPAITATLVLLSAFRNGLEGHLPAINLLPSSQVLLHSNSFTCRLPSATADVKPAFALVLLGNHFTHPVSKSFPEWIHDSERGEFFTVTNDHGLSLAKKTLCGLLALAVVMLGRLWISSWLYAPVDWNLLPKSSARMQALIRVSVRLHTTALSIVSVLLMLYWQVDTLPCLTVLERIHMPLSSGGQLELAMTLAQALFWVAFLSAFMKLLLLRADTSKRCGGSSDLGRDVGETERDDHSRDVMTAEGDHLHQANCKRSFHMCPASTLPSVLGLQAAQLKVFMMWTCSLAMSCIFAAPSSLYSIVKTVPGFLQGSRNVRWFVSQLVSFTTALLTSFCIPYVSRILHQRLGAKVNAVELFSMGKLIPMPLLPGMVTILLDESCLGEWTLFWKPCHWQHSPLRDLSHIRIARVIPEEELTFFFEEILLKRSDICQAQGFSCSRCAMSVLNRISRVLVENLMHLALTFPTMGMLRGTLPPAVKTWALVAFLWEVVAALGPEIPLLILASASALTLQYLLCCSSLSALLFSRTHEATQQEATVDRLPLFSAGVSVLCSAVLQLWLASTSNMALAVVAACEMVLLLSQLRRR